MKVTEQFEKEITPFFWIEHEESASVCLNVGEYLQEIFDTRADEGFEGNSYWQKGIPEQPEDMDAYDALKKQIMEKYRLKEPFEWE